VKGLSCSSIERIFAAGRVFISTSAGVFCVQAAKTVSEITSKKIFAEENLRTFGYLPVI
jgi:hypothetical protein